jgi:protein TonB
VQNVVNPPPVTIPAPPVKKEERQEYKGPAIVSPLPPPPPAPPAPPRPDVISDPDWQSKPDGDKLAELYPPDAADAGITGHTVTDCEVNENGTVKDCRVIEETPKGRGFDRAAIQASKYFRMRPKTRNGAPVGGARVKIALTWRLN